jgi:hypothetical protein
MDSVRRPDPIISVFWRNFVNPFISKSRLARLALAVVTAAMPLTTQAQDNNAPKAAETAQQPALEPEMWKLSVRAQATRNPALEFALLPGPADQTPGNAAPMYLLASSQAERTMIIPVDPKDLEKKGLPAADNSTDLRDYFRDEVPLDRLPVADVEALLTNYAQAFQSLDAATRREDCDWNLPIRELGFQTSMTHLNSARNLANTTALRVRLHVARKEYPQAVEAMRSIFRLGRNLSHEGMLIQSLVGTGIGAVGARQLQEMIQQPGSPNMYWPLAILPRPFIDMRETLEWERTGLLASFPQLKNAASGSFTANDWANLMNSLPGVGGMASQTGRPPASATMGPAAAGALLYPQAKQYLLGRGLPEAQVEAMPAPEVLGRYVAGQYQTVFDEMAKWTALPFWQAAAGMQSVEQELRRRPMTGAGRADLMQGPAAGATLLLMSAIPSMASAAYSQATLDRQIAALQTVEALRHYAATHEGKLPANLGELTETPAPTDPMTGKSFAYHVDGNTIKLDSPPGLLGRRGLQVEVTFVK